MSQVIELPVPTVGRILRAAWSVTRGNPWTIILITAIVYIPVDLALELRAPWDAENFSSQMQYFRMQWMLEFWLGTICSLAIIALTLAAHEGVRLSVGQAFLLAGGRYGSALWGAFLYYLGCVFGLLLLVIPGIAFALYCCFYLQAVVSTSSGGWTSLKLSYMTVKGRWWRFFKAELILLLIGLVLLIPFIVLSSFTPDSVVVNTLMGLPIRMIWAFILICFTMLFQLSREPTMGNGLTGKPYS